MRDYLTPKEIAKLEHVDPETVRRWARSDIFDGVRKVGRGYRIPIESYEQWREGTKILSDDDPGRRSVERTDGRTKLINQTRMGKIIAVSIFKGGAGKTTTSVSLAAALAKLGAKVLIADLDQQASATHHLGLDPEVENPNLYHVFKGMVPASTAIKELPFGFSILTGHSLLAAIEEALEEGDEGLLREKLEGLKHDYDLVD